MEFKNVYEDGRRAESYSNLEFPATYYLAFRDLPAIIGDYSKGGTALDFGCGAGRSTRFLRELGFDAVGVDISREMLARALERDPTGDYRYVPNEDLSSLTPHSFDLILSAFTFDNIPAMEKKVQIFQSFRMLLKDTGCIINLVSSPEIYTHEWTSFSTKDFPQNSTAKSGEKVFIVMLDVEDRRPVEDIFWTDEAYAEVYRQADLKIVRKHRPLGDPSEPFQWVSETTVSPWVIYVLQSTT
jgi:SAM-dependent methyltransferase